MSELKERAAEVIEAYGADPGRWPEEERAAIEELAERDAQIAAILNEARELDEILAADMASPVASEGLRDRLLMQAAEELGAAEQAPLRAPETSGIRRFLEALDTVFDLGGTFRPASVAFIFTACLGLGLWFGTVLSFEPLTEDDIVAAFGEDFGYLEDEETGDLFDDTGERL